VREVANSSTKLLTHTDNIHSPDGSGVLKCFESYYSLNYTMLDDNTSNTSAFVTSSILRCCSNEMNADSKIAVIGYWSPVDVENFPNKDSLACRGYSRGQLFTTETH
jgi:hypothetical protein